MNYSNFLKAVLSAITKEYNKYKNTLFAVKFAYTKTQLFHVGATYSNESDELIEVCHLSYDDATGEETLTWFSDWCEFDPKDYVFDLYGVYNIEYLVNTLENAKSLMFTVDSSEEDTNKDIKFMTDTISEICKYAKDNGMEPDDTLRTFCENVLALLEISTFNNMK